MVERVSEQRGRREGYDQAVRRPENHEVKGTGFSQDGNGLSGESQAQADLIRDLVRQALEKERQSMEDKRIIEELRRALDRKECVEVVKKLVRSNENGWSAC